MIDLFAFNGGGCAYNTLEHSTQAMLSAAQSLGEVTSRRVIKASFSAGLALPDVFRLVAPSASPEEMEGRFYEFGAMRGYDSIQAFPNVKNTLNKLHYAGARLILVTNRNRASTTAILDVTGIGKYTDDIVTGDDVSQPKPDPEGLLLAMKKGRAQRSATIFMGDTTEDIKMGIAAGVASTVGFTEGFGTMEDLLEAGANHVISNWAFVPNLIRQMIDTNLL